MRKAVVISFLATLALYGASVDGMKYANFEVTKQYGKITPNGDITNLSGSETGEFFSPNSIAILSDGSYWVSDNYNHRIQHFTKSGEFLGKVGTVDSSTRPKSGTDNNSFYNPTMIAEDSSDNIYVVDSHNKRVQKFDRTGTYMKTISNVKIKDYSGIAVDSQNNIWISDQTNDHLWKLNQDSAIVAESGFVSGTTYDAGDGDAQYNNPNDIEVASDNSIWVSDYANNRVQHISSTGTYIGQISKSGPTGIALSSTHIYTIGRVNRNIAKNELAVGNKLVAWFKNESSTSEKFGLNNPIDIEMDNNQLWIADSSNNRIKKVYENGYKTLTLEKTIAKYNTEGNTISTRADNIGFLEPKRAVGDSAGNSFILDKYSLKKYNASGEYVAGYGHKDSNNLFTASSNGKYSKYYYGTPELAVKGDKIYMFLTDFDASGTRDTAKTSVISYKTSDMSKVNGFEVYDDVKRGITVLADGSIWLAYDYHIAHYSASGTLLKTVGITDSDAKYIAGSEKEQFNNIYGIANDSSENIYVAESSNKRVQVFDKNGNYKKTFNLSFSPKYIAISPINDEIWVTEGGRKVVRLNSEGERTYIYDRLVHTKGIGFDNSGNLLLCYYAAHTMKKFSIGTQASLTQSTPEVSVNVAVNENLTVSANIEAYDEDGYITAYSIDFGDNTTPDTTSAVSHTYAAAGTYTITTVVTDNDGLTTTLKQAVIASPLSSGTSTGANGQDSTQTPYTLTQDDLDSALAEKVTACQNNPSSCGITVSHDVSLDISATKVEALSTGWHLVGSTIAITDMRMFNSAQAVWISNGTTWKAYSPNTAIAAEIASKGVDTFSTIAASSGFWILK